MGYIEDSLAPGERIVYRTKQHPVIFLPPVVLAVISLAGFLTGRENLGEISAGFAVLLAIGAIFCWRLSDFAVTNRAVTGRFFGRYTVYPKAPLVELRTIKFKSCVFSALFDYGTVVITDSQGNRHRYPGVPGEFCRQIEARLARNERILK